MLVNNFNNGPWLADCLSSLLAQTRPPDEIILYDDGSSDDSVAIARRFAPTVVTFDGPRLDRPPHINHGEAIAQAFRRSTGDILFLLDSDDLFLPQKIARYLDAFATSPRPVLVQAPLGLIDAHGRGFPRPPEPTKHTTNPFETAYTHTDIDLFYPTSSLAFTRAFLENELPIDWTDRLPAWADMRLCIAALFAGPVLTLDEELGLWRRHPQADSVRAARRRSYLLAQTCLRNRLFNRRARLTGHRALPLWKNRRFYRQLARVISPACIHRLFLRPQPIRSPL